ncbi:MAG: RNA polymerase sigma factor [Clostridia bacterium]|nr:RNA polymerase sigma factor [Clostridia bacterium]
MNREKIIEAYIENINPLRAYAYSVVHNADDADDVVQEVAVRIIQATDAGMEIQHPKAFLFRCTRNLAIDLMRKRRDIPQDDEVMERTAKTEPDIRDADFRMSLEQYIGTWEPEMKEAFIRHYFEFEPLNSIAEDLGMKPATLRARFHRMRNKIPKSIFLTMLILHNLHF